MIHLRVNCWQAKVFDPIFWNVWNFLNFSVKAFWTMLILYHLINFLYFLRFMQRNIYDYVIIYVCK